MLSAATMTARHTGRAMVETIPEECNHSQLNIFILLVKF